MAFVGVLDFRGFTECRVPGDALVFHICNNIHNADDEVVCGPGNGDEAVALTWISATDAVESFGDASTDRMLVGTAWNVTEYPTSSIRTDFNFSCYATKIGGHLHWIQSEDTPQDRAGRPMKYIGQFVGTEDVEFGDEGVVYLFHSEETQETKATFQCF